jgi:hypothetical protein
MIAKANTEIIQYPRYDVTENPPLNKGQVIRGVVRSKTHNQPLPGVNVYLKGSEETTFTVVDGRFEFPRKLQEGDVVIFSFIGL